MNRNLSVSPVALRAAEESVAYFKAPACPKQKPAPSLTPIEAMYAYYDAA
ncbi:MAG: hypothetical protein JWS10_2288 [Cypionkella sp.]|nr:hypothetical protein [Cypionkella sp.]MDB5659673.1 hypothetical protein [Cypionkella sp.]MDB5665478.1 hypothetical protein [Cypionkella sp.]